MKYFLTILFITVLISGCKNKKVTVESDVFYTCSMDPQVISDKPGKCPICGMELTPVKKSSVENTNDIELSDQQIQLGNIKSDTLGKSPISNNIILTGTLNINSSKTASVSARVAGRIERLYVKNIGDYVSKGMPLYEIYSEELNNAKQEYILALQRRNLFKEQAIIDFEQIIDGARQKLRLWGMSESQIRALEKLKQAPPTTTFYSDESGYITSLEVIEGGYVMDGGTVVQLADLSQLWAEAQVFTTQMQFIPKGGNAVVEVHGETRPITGRIEFANPEIPTETRINLLRIAVPNPGNRLKPGMAVNVIIQTASRSNSLTIPSDAIIYHSGGATVWLQTASNRFRNQMVTTGIESEGFTEITHGLKTGDVVVISGAYLLNSEYIFKRGADPMVGHDH